MLNLKKEILDYSLKIENIMKKPLINLINEVIYNDEHWLQGEVKGGLVEDIRSVKVKSFEESEISASVSKRIIFNELKIFTNQIEQIYKEEVSSFYFSVENNFQFLLYNKDIKGHYDFHTDYHKQEPRNLTILVGLNSKDEYEGGELFIQNQEGIRLHTGDVVCFPSNFLYPHKVSKVTNGERKVLVIWTS